MATIFNEQRVLGIRLVPDGVTLYNSLPVIGIVDAGSSTTFSNNQRVRGVDVLPAFKPVHNDLPVVGAVLIANGRKMYNDQLVIPVRAVSGSLSSGDPYWANVVLLAGFEGANGATAYTEESSFARAATLTGGPTITTATADLGASSLDIPGAGSATFPDSADFRLISTAGEAFTLECSARFPTISSAADQFIINQWDTGTASRAWALYVGSSANALRFQYSTDGVGGTNVDLIPAWATSGIAGKWYKLCVESDGTTLRFYVDGVMVASRAAPAFFFDCITPLAIGGRSNTLGSRMTGQIDEVRITKGVARYASDAGYTPAAFPRS